MWEVLGFLSPRRSSLGLLHLHKTSFVVASQPTGALLGVFSLSAICNLQGLDFFVLRFFFLLTLTLTTENFDGNFFSPLSPSVEETCALRMHVTQADGKLTIQTTLFPTTMDTFFFATCVQLLPEKASTQTGDGARRWCNFNSLS